MIKDLVKQCLLNIGIFSSGVKDQTDIQLIIDELKPIKTQFGLKRIGNKTGDGGYLLPNDLENINYCFSPGVSTEASFEEELIKSGVKCFLADFSVTDSPLKNDLIQFTKKFIGSYDDEKYIDINRWIKENTPEDAKDGILQMDIEGQEYEVINAIDSNILNKFRIILVEFHSLHYLFDNFASSIIISSFKKLLKSHRVVHIHPNNCSGLLTKGNIQVPKVMEFTFLRKDRIDFNKVSQATEFPHRLDVKNTNYDDIILPECWYKR